MSEEDIFALPEETEKVKTEKHRFFESLDDPAVEYRLQKLLNVNPKVWNELKEAGHLPAKGTYKEILTALFTHYRNKKESSSEKLKEKRVEAKKDDEFTLLVKQEKISNIRLNRAKERGIHIQNMEKRGLLVSKEEEFKVIEVIVRSIATILRSAADTEPKLQETVDKCFETLYRLGQTCMEQVISDEEDYIRIMMDKPLNMQQVLDALPLEQEEDEEELANE